MAWDGCICAVHGPDAGAGPMGYGHAQWQLQHCPNTGYIIVLAKHPTNMGQY